jgi:hypothetical protein
MLPACLWILSCICMCIPPMVPRQRLGKHIQSVKYYCLICNQLFTCMYYTCFSLHVSASASHHQWKTCVIHTHKKLVAKSNSILLCFICDIYATGCTHPQLTFNQQRIHGTIEELLDTLVCGSVCLSPYLCWVTTQYRYSRSNWELMRHCFLCSPCCIKGK